MPQDPINLPVLLPLSAALSVSAKQLWLRAIQMLQRLLMKPSCGFSSCLLSPLRLIISSPTSTACNSET